MTTKKPIITISTYPNLHPETKLALKTILTNTPSISPTTTLKLMAISNKLSESIINLRHKADTPNKRKALNKRKSIPIQTEVKV